MNKPYFRLLIIGAGQLGSRHLQGLSKINNDIEIAVVDPNRDALELAHNRYEEMPSNSHIHSVDYHVLSSSINFGLSLGFLSRLT